MTSRSSWIYILEFLSKELNVFCIAGACSSLPECVAMRKRWETNYGKKFARTWRLSIKRLNAVLGDTGMSGNMNKIVNEHYGRRIYGKD